jgi:acyl carrier protein
MYPGVKAMTSNNDVLAFLRTVVTEMKDFNEEDITLESTLEEVKLDSLDYVELQLAVKKEYGVLVSQVALTDGSIRTVGDFCAYVLNAPAPQVLA